MIERNAVATTLIQRGYDRWIELNCLLHSHSRKSCSMKHTRTHTYNVGKEEFENNNDNIFDNYKKDNNVNDLGIQMMINNI